MNDNDAPTRELFERLDASKAKALCGMSWPATFPFPAAQIGYAWLELDTVEKLRAACLLMEIPWPSENTKGETCRGS